MKIFWPCTTLLLSTAVCVASCSKPAPRSSVANDERVTYICTETMKIVLGPPQTTPAVNPETGKKTLVRAVYCAECQSWRPSPPPDTVAGNPLAALCPKHQIPMTPDGPAAKNSLSGHD